MLLSRSVLFNRGKRPCSTGGYILLQDDIREEGIYRMKQRSCYRRAVYIPAFTETSIKPYSNFLTERFLFNRGKRPRSYWQVHTKYYRRISEKGGHRGVLSSRYVCGGFCRRTRSPHFPIHECTELWEFGQNSGFSATLADSDEMLRPLAISSFVACAPCAHR